MIVKNEERFLERCLESIADAVDEINIVDTGSTDRTLEIARKFTSRIEYRKWRDDFAWARNESLKMATKRWIIQLDADEELVPASKAALAQLREAPAHLTGVWLRCINASDKYLGGGSVSHAIVRIFPNTERIRFHGAIHEFPSIDDSPIGLTGCSSPIEIVHHGYLSEVVNDRNKFARNMAIVQASVASHPDDPFHWYNYGMTAHLGGDQDRGIEGFERMWDLCREHGMRAFTPNGLQTLADIYTEHKNQPQKGLEYALECLKLAPRYANAHFSAGKAYFGLQRYEEAREMYRAAIADGEHIARQYVVDDEVPQWKAHCEIGSTYVAQGDDTAAVDWFERGLANRPKIQPLRINRAAALERLNRASEAESAFRSLYEDFADEQSALNLVNFLLRRNSLHEAFEIIERAAPQARAHVAAALWMAAAAVAQRLGSGDAERFVKLAHQADPGAPDVAAAVAQQAIAQGRLEDALAAAECGLCRDANDPALRYYAALACAKLQRKAEALAHLQTIPAERTGEAADLLQIALLRELDRHAEALVLTERVLRGNPANIDVVLIRSAILERLGRDAEAEAALRARLASGNERIAVELAGLYLRSGRVADARRVAERALA